MKKVAFRGVRGVLPALFGVVCACGGPQSARAPAPRASTGASSATVARAAETPASLEAASPGAPVPRDRTPLVIGHAWVPVAAGEPLHVEARNQTYRLPVAAKTVVNLERDAIRPGFVAPGESNVVTLFQQGVAFIDPAGPPMDRFDVAYENLRARNVPTLVTTDSVLHLQHIAFSEILKAVELRALMPSLTALLDGLDAEVSEMARSSGSALGEPFQNELAFLGVGRALLEPALLPHPEVAARMRSDLDKIEQHQGLALSAAESSQRCLDTDGREGRCYTEDFSQYLPRGHYTSTDELRRYFRAMMWVSRMSRRVEHDDEVVQQQILVQAMKRARCSLDRQQISAAELLGRMDQILTYLIGLSDDLNVAEIDKATQPVLGDASDLRRARDLVGALRGVLVELRGPRILSGAVEAYGADADATTKVETQGLRLLGQRFASDSEMLGRLVFEHVGPDPRHPRLAEVAQSAVQDPTGDFCERLSPKDLAALPDFSCETSTPDQWRCLCERSVVMAKTQGFTRAEEEQNRALTQVCRLMPTALDVAAVMGSALAERYTAPAGAYCGYHGELRALQESWRTSRGVAPTNLYDSWLASMTPLLSPLPRKFPTWMTGSLYQKKSLRTFVSSWSELRHDTILYVKQSYTVRRAIMIESSSGVLLDAEAYGLVEPRPDLYRELKRQSEQTRLFLRALHALPDEVGKALEDLEAALERLTQISLVQLSGAALDKKDQDYIKGIGSTFAGITERLMQAVSPATPPDAGKPRGPHDVLTTNVVGREETLKAPLVADVHTDLNTERVLEEGVGPIEWMLALSRMPNGTLSVAVGPVFSQRELVHRLDDRLTNEKWRGPMSSGRAVAAPRWWSEDRPIANGFELPCTRETCKR